MKLLFTNTRDIIPFLPSVDADITFARLELELELASEEVAEIIGEDFYEEIVTLNAKEDPTEAEIKLLKVVKLPIVTQAYRNNAASNDLAHTNDGRKVRLNDQEKLPFEWMIDRDNKANERKYYKALDRLINYLDKEDPFNWKSSEAYQNSFTMLFRTTKEFNEYFEIESRYLLLKLVPGIKKFISNEIIPRITKERWEALQTELKTTNTVTDADLLALIKEGAANYAMYWGLHRFSAQLFPEGILQNYISDTKTSQTKQVPTKAEVGTTAKSFEKDYLYVLHKIENLVKPNPSATEMLDVDFLIKNVEGDKIITL